MTPGQGLRLKIDLAAPLLRRSASAFWLTGDPRRRYLAYLQAMHMVIRASVPLMELAAARCDTQALRTYLTEHIAEERHHDEWLAEDLAAAGADPVALLSRRPPPAIASLVGAQYYWILHYHPACVLGYIGALEGIAPHPGMPAWLAGLTGYPAEAFRTLDHHARVDGGHVTGLYHLIDGLGLDEPRTTAIGCSALSTIAGLGALFTTMKEQPDVHA